MKKISICIYSLMFPAVLFAQAVEAADYTNSIGMEFNNIPAGTFFMGNCRVTDDEKKARKENHKANEKRHFMGLPIIPFDEKPCPSGRNREDVSESMGLQEREVTITNDFQIGVYEVALGQFKKFIADAGRDDLLTDDFMKSNSKGDDAAVTWVSRNDTQSFISWLNKKEGGDHYRLPTEAEWEYAARAGTTTFYSWGDLGANGRPYAWYGEGDNCLFCEEKPYTHGVGLKKPNPWGLYDMHGNVSELVEDKYSVSRGGSWNDSFYELRSSARSIELSLHKEDLQENDIGFRLLREP